MTEGEDEKKKYSVVYEQSALEGIGGLDTGDQRQVVKKLRDLETSPELGKPLGNKHGINLTGWRKFTMCNRRVRAIFRIEGEDTVRVITVAEREDLAVYALARDEVRRLGLKPPLSGGDTSPG